MKKVQKLLILLLAVCLAPLFAGTTESHAQETPREQASVESGLQDENSQRLEEVTGMNQKGDVFQLDDDAGIVESKKLRSVERAEAVYVVNFRTKGNEVTNYKEYGTGEAGYTNGAYGADAAYLGTYGDKVRFMLAGVVGEVKADEVQVAELSNAKTVSCYKVSGGRLLHYIAQDITADKWASALDNGHAPAYLKDGVTYYSYDGHYFYTDYGTMLEDYRKETRSQSVNASNPYFNYYQFLPFRSTSGYSADELNTLIGNKVSASSKMKNTGSSFVNYQNAYGVNSLIMVGVAANESAWGQSNISQTKNNLFGLNAVDSSPGTSANTYATVDECIRQFADGWMSRGYLDPSDWRYKGGFLGNKAGGVNVSYASDPYWGEKAANVIYVLDKIGGSRDAGKYTIAIKDTLPTVHNNVNVRNAAGTSSKVLYKTKGFSGYAVLVLNQTAENGFYKVMSDGVLNAARTSLDTSTGSYDFANMYAYISSDYVTVVNTGNTVPQPEPAPEPKVELQSVYVSKAPAKLVYTEGETPDLGGMKVMAKWSDGTETDVTKDVVYSKEALKAGTTSLELAYTSEEITKTVSIAITVNVKVTVTEVAVNPANAELKAGENLTFGVAVTGTGDPGQTVVWSVEGAKSKATTIDATGKLQIGEDETAEKLTVRAVSAFDETKSAAAVVTVVKKTVEPSEPAKPEEPSKPAEPEKPADPEIPEKPDQGTEIGKLEDEENGIWVEGNFGREWTLAVEQVKETAEKYEEYISPVKENTLLGVYDITLSGKTADGEKVTLGFKVDEKYNGRKVIVLHYTTSEEAKVEAEKLFVETYNAEVKDGMVTLEVTGFSPYVIALDDAPAVPEDPDKTEPPVIPGDTGDTNPPGDSGETEVPDESDDMEKPDESDNTEKPDDSDEKDIIDDAKNPNESGEKDIMDDAKNPNESGEKDITDDAKNPDESDETENPDDPDKKTTAVDVDKDAADKKDSDKTTVSGDKEKKEGVKENPPAPKTADMGHIILWNMLLVLSGIAVIIAACIKGRVRHN